MKSILTGFLIAAVGIFANATENANPFQESLAELNAYSIQIQSDVNPFKEGTQTIVLTEGDKQTLAEYALNAKTHLEKALRKASGKTLEEMHDIYVETIKKVVIESFSDQKRSQLLMRYALNQALQLTVGIPSANGEYIQTKGILSSINNKDVITVILEDSIRLAVRYYQDDITAIQSGNLVKLPYITFGNERLALAQSWSHAIHESDLLLAFQVKTLEQWMSTVANNEVLDRLKIGEAILNVDEALVDVKKTNYSTAQKIRYLRGVIDELFIVLKSLGYRVSERTVPVLSSNDEPGLTIVIDLNEVDGHESLKLQNKVSLDLVIGQGYTGKYFFKDPNYWTQPDKNGKIKGPYKSKSAEDIVEMMRPHCENMARYASAKIICAPIQKIPRALQYVSNQEFQENHTVPFEVGVYVRSYESPTLE